MLQCCKETELWDAETWLQDVGCHSAAPLSAGEGSGAGLCQDCATAHQKNKPPGESASKKMIWDLDNMRCEEKLQQ